MEMNMTGADGLRNQPGVLQRLAGTLIKPRTAIASLSKVKRSWWRIPVLLVIAGIIVSVVSYSYADCQYVHRLEMDHYTSSPNQRGRPPEPPTPLPITMAIRAGGRVISTGIAWLAWSGVLYLAVSRILTW